MLAKYYSHQTELSIEDSQVISQILWPYDPFDGYKVEYLGRPAEHVI